jgi:long-chain acyl-CoA synthetase
MRHDIVNITREIEDLKDMIQQSSKLYYDKYAFRVKMSNGIIKKITYIEFKNDVDSLGTAFHYLGLKDKKIAVLGENRYEWCVTYLAVANGTGVIVPLDKELPVHELENLVNRAEVSAIIFSGKYEEKIRQISAPGIEYFINMDTKSDSEEFLSYELLQEKGATLIKKGITSFIEAKIDRDKMSMLIFTSGTTDHAKGVILSHKNICSNIVAVCSVISISDKDSVLSILPLHHTYECTCGFLLIIYNGAMITFNDSLKNTAKNLKEVKPTILIAVPLILESMYKKIKEQANKDIQTKILFKSALIISKIIYNILNIDLKKKLFKKVHENLGGQIRFIISGAAAINESAIKGYRDLGIPVLQGYGLTECSPIVTVNREYDFSDSSIGHPIPGVELRIDSPNSNGIGEIVVKGKNVLLGYYDNMLATQKVLIDGWFYTGDLGKMDRQGHIYITGRKKNIIVTKNGKNIFPEEVEFYLNKSRFIIESLVFGLKEKQFGDIIVSAQIVPDVDTIKQYLQKENVSSEEIYNIINVEIRKVNKSMPLYKKIYHFSIREEEFVKTTTQKIKRYEQKISCFGRSAF